MDRAERIKKHKMNMDDVWYHGGNHDIKHFDYDYLSKGKDAYGSGFYFTNKPDTASAYASDAEKDGVAKGLVGDSGANVLPVHLSLTKAVPHNKSLTTSQITKIIKDSPDYDMALSNHGDVDYEGEARVLRNAVSTYKDHDAIDAMNVLHNDFYQNHPKEFLQSFTKHTGYDHVIKDFGDEKFAIVFHPHQIRSVYADFDIKKMKSHNISESYVKSYLDFYSKAYR